MQHTSNSNVREALLLFQGGIYLGLLFACYSCGTGGNGYVLLVAGCQLGSLLRLLLLLHYTIVDGSSTR